ncbi:MAG: IS5/IS1182 family transposase, partial [Methanothrix sp.]
VFSAIKRIFGETVRATSKESMIREVRRMFTFYTIILSV